MKALSVALYVSFGVLVATPVLAHQSDNDQPRAAHVKPAGRDHHDRLRQLDLNHDGRITTHELRAVQRHEQATHSRPQVNRFDDHRHGWQGTAAVDHRTQRTFAKLDRNRDGVISAKEWRVAQHFWRNPPRKRGW